VERAHERLMTRTILLACVTDATVSCTSSAERNGFAGDTRRTSDIRFARHADATVDRAGLPPSTRPAALRPWDGPMLTPDEYDRATAVEPTGPTAQDAAARPAP